MSGSRSDLFENIARRLLQDGRDDLTDDDVLTATSLQLKRVAHLRPIPEDALARIAVIRASLPPPPTDSERWAMVDDALRFTSPRGTAQAPACRRRRRGRPRMTQDAFWRKYREAVDKVGPDATDAELATGEVFMYADERQFQRYVALHGRPPEYRPE